MLAVNVLRGTTLERINFDMDGELPDRAVWIDLFSPTQSEDKLVERALGIAVPTREEMQEIEVTSRLYVENGARYMTATLMCQSDEVPRTTAVTFILSGHRLVTVRYDEPKPFAIVGAKLARQCPPTITGETVLMELLDAVIDRAADILERIGADVDAISHDILEFRTRHEPRPQLQGNPQIDRTPRRPHLQGAREPGVDRPPALYLAAEADTMKWAKDQRAAIKGMQRDVQSLSDHATYLSQKINFLLDAMLGVVSLEQNNIIKIFSVAAVVFMPPTLIASIYGMNFRHMPELEYEYAYPMALALMLLAAVLPYFFFKWMKWL